LLNYGAEQESGVQFFVIVNEFVHGGISDAGVSEQD
jgi:hypothetical protein